MSERCGKHGGDLQLGDAWLCDVCARDGIDPCSCGSPARLFGEALMSSVSCESCDQFVMGVDVEDIRSRWNSGERGVIPSHLPNESDQADVASDRPGKDT